MQLFRIQIGQLRVSHRLGPHHELRSKYRMPLIASRMYAIDLSVGLFQIRVGLLSNLRSTKLFIYVGPCTYYLQVDVPKMSPKLNNVARMHHTSLSWSNKNHSNRMRSGSTGVVSLPKKQERHA